MVFFIPEMAKVNFLYPLLQSSVSHDPSEIILICLFDVQQTFIIIINVKNSSADYYLYWNHDSFLRVLW